MYEINSSNKICPLCNGLKAYDVVCKNCNGKMVDRGKVSDYYDNYSPYLPETVLAEVNEENQMECTHLFYCTKCDYCKRITIKKEEI
ncbi:hypothetical protein SH2C18_04040 [Clostridium sediminicola]|uniref:hypothetical protein n=1 Tax=Clostridium sediminicola TaxID=3114879 RepID=UPI0031F225AE